MRMATGAAYAELIDRWMEDDNLLLLSSWTREGIPFKDIAKKMGISVSALTNVRKQCPEIDKALKQGKELIDYKVENALLKAALGYKTKEVKVTTLMRFGKVIETTKEVTDKEIAPSVPACQFWLTNALPDKWKRNRDNSIELDEEDQELKITVKRASRNQDKENPKENHTVSAESYEEEIDQEWQKEINSEIVISKKTEEEKKEERKKARQEKRKAKKEHDGKAKIEKHEEDLDYWPDNWEELIDEDN